MGTGETLCETTWKSLQALCMSLTVILWPNYSILCYLDLFYALLCSIQLQLQQEGRCRCLTLSVILGHKVPELEKPLTLWRSNDYSNEAHTVQIKQIIKLHLFNLYLDDWRVTCEYRHGIDDSAFAWRRVYVPQTNRLLTLNRSGEKNNYTNSNPTDS